MPAAHRRAGETASRRGRRNQRAGKSTEYVGGRSL